MIKMSIHRGLSELKMLDKRIERSIKESKFVGSKKKSAENVDNTTTSKDKFIENIKKEYQSIQSLIKRRTEVKRLIVLSNAKTMVVVGDKEYTVAEAIENKKIIENKKELLKQLKTQLNTNMAQVSKKNEEVESRLDEQIQIMLGSDKQSKTAGLEGFINQYKEQNEWELVDGLEITSEINKLENEIDEFENNIDFVLSESNAITFIEVEN
ncbi:hypothetical protein [Clostridium saccharoperbutylacetonicum]|uniref:hypothetical protein n=1 Tax=Clostridium saccharoperbutylacetonicum TaxID=36745 RepID=UPI000983F65F|nr:hypothetical protein [Clostridium saccharoperbutylacetonicum]AQR96548.1 hypothetical protein CLSAP_38720 [Clostridium saccharoperbutylacetonicum]NSB32424.1 hypothetical protein [Clostridium saccharoperbutylacetonicum]